MELPIYSLKNLTQCKANNPNVKWTIPHYKKQIKESILKKTFLIETQEG